MENILLENRKDAKVFILHTVSEAQENLRFSANVKFYILAKAFIGIKIRKRAKARSY